MRKYLNVIILFLTSWNVWAAGEPNEDLYVRPITGEYGGETGLSYAAAFDGKAAVTFSDTPGTAGSVDAGDTLHVCGAFVDEGAMQGNDIDGASGTNVITVDGDCSANGDLSQATWTGSSTGTTPGLRMLNSTYVTVKNLLITRTGGSGVQFDSSPTNYNTDRNITFQNVSVSWAGYGQSQTAGKNNFTLHGNIYTLTDVYSGFAMDDNLWIQGNTITLTRVESEGSNFNDVSGYGDGLQCGGAGLGANCSNLVVTDSVFRESSHYKQAFNATSHSGENLATATGPALIYDNEFYCPINPVNSGSGCVTIWGFDAATFHHNYVYGGTGVSFVNTSTNNVIYSNIITGGPQSWFPSTTANGLSVEGTGHAIYHNSISNVFRGISANGSGTLTRNNIVVNTLNFGVFAGGGGGGSVETNNYCYSCATTGNSAFPNGVGTNSSVADPQLISAFPILPNQFKLKNTSPAARTGLRIGPYHDYSGLKFYNLKPSIGAFEQAARTSSLMTARSASSATRRSSSSASNRAAGSMTSRTAP